MTKKSAEQIIKRYTKADSVKSSWNTEYREVFDYCMPSRNIYSKVVGDQKANKNYQDNRENLYSSTGEQAANDFVNTMQEVLAPPSTPWVSLEAGMEFEEDARPEVNLELDKLTDFINEYKNNSNFDQVFSEFCYDVFAGTGCLLVLPHSPKRPMVFSAIPINQYCIEEGVMSEVRAVYRKYTMKRELLGAMWKELKSKKLSEEEGEKDIDIIESTFFDYDLNVWHYQVIDKANCVELVSREYKTNPFIVLRWNKCAGEPYGRGVGIAALNDIKTENLIQYYALRALAYQLPILLASEDSMLDVDNFMFEPLSINIVPDVETSLKTLPLNGNFDITAFKTEELRVAIKKATYSSTLPNTANKQLTATEVNAILNEIRKSLNSVFGRILNEFQVPIVLRMVDVLTDTGVMGEKFKKAFNIDDINGLRYKVNIITPIAKIIRHSEAQAILGVLMTLVQLDPTGGLAKIAIKVDKTLNHYVKLSGMPDFLVNTPKEIEVARQKEQEEMSNAQQGALNAEVNAENEKAMGKAMAQEAVNNA